MSEEPQHLSSRRLASHGSAKLDAGQVRLQNQRLLLNLIWSERSISRAELARRTGLSRSTVSAIVAGLMDTGLVSFRGAGQSQGGRRPVMLGFDDDALTLVGVDMGATHVGVAITDLRAKVLAWRRETFPVRDDPDGALALIETMIHQGLAEAGCAQATVVGIGVGVPSPVDPNRPEQLSTLVLPAWTDVDIPARLTATFGCRVVLDNDANLGALAEFWWGAGRSCSDMAFVKVATGIGCGYIIRGEIYRGATGVAGEIGHIVVDTGGPPCVCGLNGCLATLVGTEAMGANARDAVAEAPGGALDPDDLTMASLATAAREGDPVAADLVRGAGRHLGIAIAGLVNLLNPAIVVLGGDLMRARDIVLEPLQAALRKRTLWLALDDTSVVVGELGEREVAVGAATLMLKSALDDPALFPATEASASPAA